MVKKTIAALVFGLFGLVLTAGCDGFGLGGEGGEGGSLDALAEADPVDVARAELQAAYFAYVMQGRIEQEVSDPDSVDDATLQAMADELAPEVTVAAEQWVASLDPASIPQFIVDPDKQQTCIDKYGCEPSETCSFTDGKAACPLVDCGHGKCDGCPQIYNLNSLLVTGWCAHVCLRGAPARVRGYKAVIHFRGGRKWGYCYEAAN